MEENLAVTQETHPETHPESLQYAAAGPRRAATTERETTQVRDSGETDLTLAVAASERSAVTLMHVYVNESLHFASCSNALNISM